MTFLGKTLSLTVQQFCKSTYANDIFRFTNVDEYLDGYVGIKQDSHLNLEYSYDKKNWETRIAGEAMPLNRGQPLYLRATEEGNEIFYKIVSRIYTCFTFLNSDGRTGNDAPKIRCDGDIRYLLSQDGTGDTCPDKCFQNSFKNCVTLISAPSIPYTQVGKSSLLGTFYNCIELQSHGNISPEIVDTDGFAQTFFNCTRLTDANSKLDTLVSANANAFFQMYAASGISSSPEIILSAAGYTGRSTVSPTDYPFGGMFTQCPTLISAGNVMINYVDDAYNTYGTVMNMFAQCSALTGFPTFNIQEESALMYGVFQECKSLQEAPPLTANTVGISGYVNLFAGCENLTSVPEIHAVNLSENCFTNMLSGCPNLQYVHFTNLTRTKYNQQKTELNTGNIGIDDSFEAGIVKFADEI